CFRFAQLQLSVRVGAVAAASTVAGTRQENPLPLRQTSDGAVDSARSWSSCNNNDDDDDDHDHDDAVDADPARQGATLPPPSASSLRTSSGASSSPRRRVLRLFARDAAGTAPGAADHDHDNGADEHYADDAAAALDVNGDAIQVRLHALAVPA